MSNDYWLVRTSLNEIIGPMSRDALISQIREGKIGIQDEVCRADSYWIYLDEVDEVKKQLGIEMPRSQRKPEDGTETDTQSETRELSLPMSGEGSNAFDSDDSNLSESELTQVVLTSRDSQRSDTRQAQFDRRFYRAPLGGTKPLILGKVERPSMLRVMLAVMIVLTGVLVAFLIRYVQNLP
jgi:hypothetical protein